MMPQSRPTSQNEPCPTAKRSALAQNSKGLHLQVRTRQLLLPRTPRILIAVYLGLIAFGLVLLRITG